MPLAVNDVIQMTVVGRKDGQTILNVFHWQCTTAPSTGSVAENLLALATFLWDVDVGSWNIAWTAVLPDDYSIQAIRMQRVAPVRSAYIEGLFIDAGEIAVFQSEVPNLTWVFVKQSELAGRRGKGTTHMLLPAFNWAVNGELTIEGSTERSNLLALVDDQQSPPAGGVFAPVIYHPGFSPNFSRITHATQKNEIRTMRRRTVGRGI